MGEGAKVPHAQNSSQSNRNQRSQAGALFSLLHSLIPGEVFPYVLLSWTLNRPSTQSCTWSQAGQRGLSSSA